MRWPRPKRALVSRSANHGLNQPASTLWMTPRKRASSPTPAKEEIRISSKMVQRANAGTSFPLTSCIRRTNGSHDEREQNQTARSGGQVAIIPQTMAGQLRRTCSKGGWPINQPNAQATKICPPSTATANRTTPPAMAGYTPVRPGFLTREALSMLRRSKRPQHG